MSSEVRGVAAYYIYGWSTFPSSDSITTTRLYHNDGAVSQRRGCAELMICNRFIRKGSVLPLDPFIIGGSTLFVSRLEFERDDDSELLE
jgi:hypothetical protein